jgi:hypothetical protein
MAKCINQVINRDVKVRGPVPLSSKAAGSSKVDDEAFFESFKDSISGAAKRLRTVNCSDVVLDYFGNALGSTGNKNRIRAGYDWVSNNVNLQTSMQALGGLGDKLSPSVGFDLSKVTTIFCVTITNIFRQLVFFIENALKIAIGLFKLIDKYLNQLENAIQDFLDSVRDCIVSVMVDAKLALNKLVTNVLDFDIVLELMESCPCVTEIFASIFNCTDSQGNRMTVATDVFECMVDTFSLNPADLLGPINNFIDDTLIANIELGYNVLQESISFMMELLITPLRELVKGYCFLLTEKINVTYIIKALGPSKCLLVYTTELDDDKREFEGMSILDMISTLKLWTGCFEFVCAPFIEESKFKIKEYQEKFRLDAKYWNNVFTLDIYTSCIMANIDSNTTRPTAIREVYAANVGKGKDVFTGITDVFKDLGKIVIESADDERNIGEVYESIRNKEGPDEEEAPIIQGNQNYYGGVEDKIVAVTRNLGSAINAEPNYERYMNLLTWETRYRKQQNHIELLNQVRDKYRNGTKSVSDVREITTAINDTSTTQVIVGHPTINSGLHVPSYAIPVDYNPDEAEKIKDSSIPNKQPNENLVMYYGKWFNSIME